MLRLFFFVSIFTILNFFGGTSHAEDFIKFGETDYKISGIAVTKSSSARLARFDDDNPEILSKHIYLPAGTVLFLLDHFERDPRTYQLAVSEHGMPLYVLNGPNYFPATRFVGMKGEYAAIPRTKFVIDTKIYGAVTLTPSEVYAMTFLDYPNIAITLGKAKMEHLYKKDEIVTVPEDSFAYVTLPIEEAAQPPTPTQIYDFNSALEDILDGVAEQDVNKIQRFKEYASGRFITRKECEDVINYGLGVEADLVAEFDTWLSPVDAKLQLTGNFQVTRTHEAGTEFIVERYTIGDRIYEIKDERVAADCVNLDDNRRIRIAAGSVLAQLNSMDASDLKLRTDPKGRIIYTCRDEYLKIEKTLSDQELRMGPTRLLISRFTIYEDPKNAAQCRPAD